MEDKKLEFNGKGFSREEPTPQELSEWRERQNHYDSNFKTPEEFLKTSGLLWVSKVASGTPAFLKAFVTVGVVAGAYTALKNLGIF